MVWPLEPHGALDFVQRKHEVLVVEEKRGIIESQFKEYFYDYPGRKPKRMVGKADENGERLVPWVGELSPVQLAPIVASRLDRVFGGTDSRERAEQALQQRRSRSSRLAAPSACPTSVPAARTTPRPKSPKAHRALAGIGCHFMASWMDRDTDGLIQMGGEGVNWIPRSMFNGGQHVFQNLGDGTFYHSGSLAIRQAVAAGTNITYKILYNDAVAMTGGQPVDGPISVQSIAHSVRAEGVQRIALVSDEPELIRPRRFPDRPHDFTSQGHGCCATRAAGHSGRHGPDLCTNLCDRKTATTQTRTRWLIRRNSSSLTTLFAKAAATVR